MVQQEEKGRMPTFAIGNKQPSTTHTALKASVPVLQCVRRMHQHARRMQGFTLVELLVVFAIGALMIGLTPVAFERLRDSSQYKDTVRSLLTDLRSGRQQAVSQGQEVLFQVNVAQRTYALAGRKPHDIPKPLEITATFAALETTTSASGHTVGIRFLPSGGSTGGSLDIKRPSGAGVRLKVDWLSGRVTQEPLVP